MRAIVTTDRSSRSALRTPIAPPGPGDVLVRVTAAGFCHTELHFLSGLLNLGVAPLTLGHEVVGRVERAGSASARWLSGLIQLAALSGAEVIAVSRTPAKRARAQALGAAHVLNARATGAWPSKCGS